MLSSRSYRVDGVNQRDLSSRACYSPHSQALEIYEPGSRDPVGDYVAHRLGREAGVGIASVLACSVLWTFLPTYLPTDKLTGDPPQSTLLNEDTIFGGSTRDLSQFVSCTLWLNDFVSIIAPLATSDLLGPFGPEPPSNTSFRTCGIEYSMYCLIRRKNRFD